MTDEHAHRVTALTHSSWINAWTLRRACAALGVDLRVAPGPREMPLPQAAPGVVPQWLFFTEEASLAAALQGRLAGRFWPRRFPQPLLDDKWAFAAWLAEDPAGPQGLPQWPLEAARDRAGLPWPLMLKARHSWQGTHKLPRGWVCRTPAELDAALARLAADGLPPQAFFLQRWMADQPMRLLSVCGFFDAGDESRNLHLLTERVADYGPGPSSSAMLVTVPDEAQLAGQAAHVLRRLGYVGPYELEFIVCAQGSWLLELNARFWMQHGLFLATGNGLVRRYLGLDGAVPAAAPPPPPLAWIDGTWLLRRLAALDRRVPALLWHWLVKRGHRAVICPGLGAAAWTALWRAARALRLPGVRA
jgi:hypothetical protein